MIEIVVKVGERTNIIFNNAVVKPIRAITIEEVRSIIKNNTVVKYVVLEKVTEREYEQTKEFIEEFEKVEGRKVFFHVPDMDDEETNGIADELNRDVYLTLEKLHNVINVYGGIDVVNRIEKMESNGDMFDTSFMDSESKEPEIEEETEVVEEVQEPEIEEVQEPEIEEVQEPEMVEEVQEPEMVEEVREPEIEEPKIEEVQEPEIEEVEEIQKPGVGNTQLTELTNQMESLRSEKLVLEKQVKEYEKIEKELNKANERVIELEGSIAKINIELKELANERDRYIEKSDSASIRISELGDKLMAEAEDTSRLDEKVSELSRELESSIAEKTSVQLNYEKELETNNRLSEDYRELSTEIEELKSVHEKEREETNSIYGREKEEIQEAHKKDLENLRVEELKKVESEKKRVGELEAQIRQIEEERAEGEKPLRDRISKLEKELESKEAEYNGIQMKYNSILLSLGGAEDGAMAIIDRNKELEEGYQNKLIAIQKLEKEIESLRSNEKIISNYSKGLEARNTQMSTVLKSQFESKASSDSLSIMPINYKGKAKIITVFGSGSYGTTTVAVSTALSLSEDSRVIVVDFDLASAKMDAKLLMRPTANAEIASGQKNTALGILLEKGVQTFKDNYINIVRDVPKGNGKLHYLSGVYTEYSSVSLISTDFDSFINFLGRQYDYIVMDFGRISDSQIGTGILKTFSRLAYRNIAVTTNQKFEIRNLKRLMEQKGLNGKTGYIINMAYNTDLDIKDRERVKSNVYGIIPFIQNFFGEQLNLFEHENKEDRMVAKDRLELFLNTLLER